MKWLGTILILYFLSISICSLAQNNTSDHDVDIEIPEVALIGLASDVESNVTLNVLSPAEAGNEVDLSQAHHKSIWINYSSIVRNQIHKRKVIAMVQGEMPAGIRLTVEASEASGFGNGKLGEPVGKITLSEQPNDLIVNIGSCYTGKGTNNGHYLTYKLEPDKWSENFEEINNERGSVSVLYTLTDIN